MSPLIVSAVICTLCFVDVSVSLTTGKLFVVGGRPEAAFGNVEVVDILGPGENCPDVADYPRPVDSAVGAYVDGKILVCGGYDNTNKEFIADCYSYDSETNSWRPEEPLLQGRAGATAVLLEEETNFWVTGGCVGTTYLTSTEIILRNGTNPFVDLPRESCMHNVVRVNDTHLALVGHLLFSTKAWLFDATTSTWSSLPDLPAENNAFSAGLAKHEDGRRELVVVGGSPFSNFSYALDLDTLEWQSRPVLPENRFFSSNVPFSNTWLLVGGSLGGTATESREILELNISSGLWLTYAKKMKVGRDLTAAFFVPEDMFDCT